MLKHDYYPIRASLLSDWLWVTSSGEEEKDNGSLFAWLTWPMTFASQRSRLLNHNGAHLEVPQINRLESRRWSGLSLKRAAAAETSAFTKQTVLGVWGWKFLQERIQGTVLHNRLKNRCLQLFSLIYFGAYVISYKMAVLVAISVAPRESGCLLLTSPTSFVQPSCRSLLSKGVNMSVSVTGSRGLHSLGSF